MREEISGDASHVGLVAGGIVPVVDWKKYRESIGYTQAKVSKDAKAWPWVIIEPPSC
jgi:hypothetical protein